MKYNDILKLTKELDEYAKLEGSEMGECCFLLSSLSSYVDYLSDDFYESLILEIKDNLNFFKTNCEIVNETIVSTNVIKSLEWK